MEKRIHKVNSELCAGCQYRARESAFDVYHCDYASIKMKCRLDPPGKCTHYEKDKLYNPVEAKRKEEDKRERQRAYKKEHRVKSMRPVGRPRKGE